MWKWPPLPGPKAFIITQGEAARTAGGGLLARLRAAGISRSMEYGARSMGKQMKAADRARARYALVIGDDEVAQGVVQFKSLADHWQHMVPLGEAVDWLAGQQDSALCLMQNALLILARWLFSWGLPLWLGGLLAIGAIVAPVTAHLVERHPASVDPSAGSAS